MVSPGQADVTDVHEDVNLARKFREHEGASDVVSVKRRLAKNGIL